MRDQNALSEEIVNAITGNQLGEPMDEAELEEELEALQQKDLDEAMVKTGTVPIADEVNRMPVPSNAERKCHPGSPPRHVLTGLAVSSKKKVEEEDEEAEFRRLEAEMAM